MTAQNSQTGIKVEDPSKAEKVELTGEQLDEKSKDFKELLEDEMEQTIDQIKSEFSDRDQEQMGERGKVRLRQMRDKIANLRGMYQEALDKYRESVKAGRTDLAELSKQLRANIAKETQTKLKNLKAVIDVKAGNQITTAEVRDLEKAFKALEDFEKNHKDLQPVFDKLAQRQNLSKQEYRLIAALVKPHTINGPNSSPLGFEVTAAGLLISMMKPAQKYEFTEQFIESDQGKDSVNLIDTFLQWGVLTRVQGEKLFEKAIEKGKITREQFEKQFKQKLESGFYEQKIAQLKAKIKEEIKHTYAGQYSENFLNRFSNLSTLGGALMTIHGLVVGLFNGLASRGDGFFAGIEKFVTGGYGPLGLVEAAVGTEMMTGSFKQGKDTEWLGIGSGVFGQFFSSPGEDEEIAAKKNESAEAIADIYLNTHKSFAEYLENGGFDTMKKLGQEIEKHPQQTTLMSLDGLLKFEQDANQKKRLQALNTATTVTKDTIADKLNSLALHTDFLQIKTNQQFTKYLDHIKNSQFPT